MLRLQGHRIKGGLKIHKYDMSLMPSATQQALCSLSHPTHTSTWCIIIKTSKQGSIFHITCLCEGLYRPWNRTQPRESRRLNLRETKSFKKIKGILTTGLRTRTKRLEQRTRNWREGRGEVFAKKRPQKQPDLETNPWAKIGHPRPPRKSGEIFSYYQLLTTATASKQQ